MPRHPGRYGWFRIPRLMIDTDPQNALLVQRDILIVRAQADFRSDSIEYLGICEGWDEIGDGETAPTYDWTLTRFHPDDPPSTVWKRRP